MFDLRCCAREARLSQHKWRVVCCTHHLPVLLCHLQWRCRRERSAPLHPAAH